MEEIKQTNEMHECSYNIITIEKIDSCVLVTIDCSCEESKPKEIVRFFDNPLISADDDFKHWFESIVPYLIQKNYRIKDLRK